MPTGYPSLESALQGIGDEIYDPPGRNHDKHADGAPEDALLAGRSGFLIITANDHFEHAVDEDHHGDAEHELDHRIDYAGDYRFEDIAKSSRVHCRLRGRYDFKR